MMKKNEVCRLCKSRDLGLIFKMPLSPPVDNFRKLDDEELSLPSFPMDLYMCNACHHAQLLDVVSQDILYGNYIYTSSSSPDLDKHFTCYVSRVLERLNLTKNSKILDIGSNDGLLLSKFKEKGFKVLGIDPSRYVASLALEKGIETEVGFLNVPLAAKVENTYGKADLITANNVFSHADDLREFAVCVHSLLADGGTFVFEVSYLKDMIDNFVMDYIYHEHLCYHSILPLKQFLASCQLKLIDVERIPTKGGSIRCYAVKSNDSRRPELVVDQLIAEEFQSGLYNRATYKELQRKFQEIREKLTEMCQLEISKGNRIAAYGASATSTVLNSLLGISQFISFVIDDNALRQGRFSPGYLTPVLGSEALMRYKPSLTIVSAWRFTNDIMRRNQQYLSSGGCFIVPLPNVRIESMQQTLSATR